MDNVNIPPLKFTPILKSVVWGGEKIAPFKGIVTDQKNIGESWEISGVRGNESVVVNGPDAGLTLTRMIEKYGADLVGSHVYKRFGNTFPLLIKIIDAAGDLSLTARCIPHHPPPAGRSDGSGYILSGKF